MKRFLLGNTLDSWGAALRVVALLAVLATALLPAIGSAHALSPPQPDKQSGLVTQDTRYQPPASAALASGTGVLLPRLGGVLAALLAAVAVLLGCGGLYVLTAPNSLRTRMDRFVSDQGGSTAPGGPPPGFNQRVLYPLFDNLGHRLNALTPSSYLDQVQQMLYRAGPPYRMQRSSFLGQQSGLALGLALAGLVWAVLTAPGEPLKWAASVGAGLFAGFYLPYYQLAQRVTKRKKKLLRALPAALDFLVVMIEAGTGLDSALNELTRRWPNTLSDEFALLLIDFQIGKARRAAWRDLVARTQVPELNSFVLAMVQSEQTGASIGIVLRAQADQMRIRRRQRAEEEARMAPVKMLIPMGLFIFPCIMIVILGPAVPQILSGLGNLGH